MEDNSKDAGGRRDYGQDGEKRYSSEGRVLRPRKKVGTGAQPHRNYGEHHGPDGGPRRFEEHRDYGERRSYGAPRKDYNDNRGGYGERKSYGDGERRS